MEVHAGVQEGNAGAGGLRSTLTVCPGAGLIGFSLSNLTTMARVSQDMSGRPAGCARTGCANSCPMVAVFDNVNNKF